MTREKITLRDSSTKEDYDKVYSLEVGDVFKYDGNYETIMRLLLEDYLPDNLLFEVFPINPGTSLYTIYGYNHIVVTSKILVNTENKH